MQIKEIKNNIFKSSFIGIFRVIIAIPLYLILTPFVLNKLGIEDFAIWSFSTIIISLISLGDFGFKNSLIYHITKNIDSEREQNSYFNNALLMFLVIAAVIITFTMLFAPYFTKEIIDIPSDSVDKAIFVLGFVAVSFAFRFIGTPYQAMIESHQKIYFSHYTMIAWLISNFIFTIIALNITPSIYHLTIASIFPNIIVFAMYFFKSCKDYKYISHDFSLISFRYMKEMLKYGSGIHLATIAIAIREPIIKSLIAKNTDLLAVTIFELSYRLCIQAVSIIKTPLLSVFSASALLANDKESLNKIITPFCNYNIAFLIPSSVFFFIFSAELIALWLGDQHGETAEILPYMFLSLSIYYLTEPLYKTIEASGRSLYSAIIQVIVIATCIVLFDILSENAHYTSAYVLLISFSIFSTINMLSFRVFFRGIKTYNFMKSLTLFLLGYICVLYISNEEPIFKFSIFPLYLLMHFYLCRKFKLFDVIHLIKKIIALFKKNNI